MCMQGNNLAAGLANAKQGQAPAQGGGLFGNLFRNIAIGPRPNSAAAPSAPKSGLQI